MKVVRRCSCGRMIRFDGEVCGVCRVKAERAVQFKSLRLLSKPEPRAPKPMSDREIVAPACSLLRATGAMVPHGPVVVYKPGDAGFDRIALQYI